MNFKRRHNWKEWGIAALVVIMSIGVPIWLLVVALITESVLMWLFLILYVLVGYSIAWRVENG